MELSHCTTLDDGTTVSELRDDNGRALGVIYCPPEGAVTIESLFPMALEQGSVCEIRRPSVATITTLVRREDGAMRHQDGLVWLTGGI